MRGKLASQESPCFPERPFNEARALCAGSSAGDGDWGEASFAFNEARALCAGSCHAPIPAPFGGPRLQ